jgi:hypothetical protein
MANIPQRVYPTDQALGVEGQIADATSMVVHTGVNESEAMPAGRAVTFNASGTVDRSVILPSATGQILKGVTAFSHFTEVLNPTTGVAQVYTLTVGGTAADGTYSFVFEIPDDTAETVTISVVRTGGAPASNNDLAAAFRTAFNADTLASAYAQAAGTGADVVITKSDPGSFAITSPTAPGTGTLTGALTTSGEQDLIPANEPANLLKKGTIWARPEDAVTPASDVFYRHTANAGVGTALGGFRTDNDGASQVTRGDVAFNGTDDVGLYIDGFRVFVASNTSDDQTATDLRDEIILLAANIPGTPTATIDTSGSESWIILTFADYATHTVTSYSPATADITSISNTTAAVVRADQIVDARWLTSASAGQLAKLEVNIP